MVDNFLNTSFIYLLVAVLVVPLSKRLGLGSVLGYLLSGIFLAQISGLSGDHHSLLSIGEIGVVMMLFLIGLELEPKLLWNMRFHLLGMGGLQVVATTALIAFGVSFFFPWQIAVSIGLILALSSTAIVLQTLQERKIEKTPAGQAMFSVLLFQDVAVIPFIALLSILALSAENSGLSDAVQSPFSQVIDPGYALLIFVVGLVVVGLGYVFNKPVLHYIARTGGNEIFTATALLLVVGSALLMVELGLSPALGTFIAGLVLARSEFVHEIRSSIEPFKGLFLGLFFVGVGMGLQLDILFDQPFTIVLLTCALLLAKGMVLLGISFLFRLPRINAWLFSLGLAQAGEFGFVLIGFASESGLLNIAISSQLVVIVTLSMLLTPLLFIAHNYIERSHHTSAPNNQTKHDMSGQVIIAGIGRFGQIINRMLVAHGLSTVVIDKDATLLEQIQRVGVKAYYGDATKPSVLNSVGLRDAALLVVAIDNRQQALSLVQYARRHYPRLRIIARAYDRLHLYSLRKAGADVVVRESYDGAVRCAEASLTMLQVPKDIAQKQAQAFVDLENESLEELYEIWDKNHEIQKNPAYLAGIKQRNEELRKALAGDKALQADFDYEDSELATAQAAQKEARQFTKNDTTPR